MKLFQKSAKFAYFLAVLFLFFLLVEDVGFLWCLLLQQLSSTVQF